MVKPRLTALLVLTLSITFAATPPLAQAKKHSRHHAASARHHTTTALADGGARYAPVEPTVGPPSGPTAHLSGAGGTSAPSAPTGPTGASGPTGPVGPVGVTGPSGAPGASVARILPSGLAVAPADAPDAVKAAIAAGNQLIGEPYLYGGGHKSFIATGYDCSGAVSFALHGGGLLSSPLDSSAFEQWGAGGSGRWITVYTNPQHAYVDIAGIRLDTSAAGDAGGQSGPRWRPLLRPHTGFEIRPPAGL